MRWLRIVGSDFEFLFVDIIVWYSGGKFFGLCVIVLVR